MSPYQVHPPELLYLLAGDPAELAETVAPMRSVDVAEALNTLPPDAAARVLTAVPFDLAVQVLDEPGLENEAQIFPLIAESAATYAAVVRARTFPTADQTYRPKG